MDLNENTQKTEAQPPLITPDRTLIGIDGRSIIDPALLDKAKNNYERAEKVEKLTEELKISLDKCHTYDGFLRDLVKALGEIRYQAYLAMEVIAGRLDPKSIAAPAGSQAHPEAPQASEEKSPESSAPQTETPSPEQKQDTGA